MEEKIILAIVIAYLLGSIPFAYIMGRLVKGVDIRQVGGGNMGAVNTMREIGPIPGFTVLLADMAKGALAILVAQWLDIPLFWVFVAGGVYQWPSRSGDRTTWRWTGLDGENLDGCYRLC